MTNEKMAQDSLLRVAFSGYQLLASFLLVASLWSNSITRAATVSFVVVWLVFSCGLWIGKKWGVLGSLCCIGILWLLALAVTVGRVLFVLSKEEIANICKGGVVNGANTRC